MNFRITLLIELAVILIALSGCMNPYKPMQPLPGILTPAPAEVVLNPTVTDYDVLVYSNGTKLVLSGRVSNLERGDLALALTGSALASGGAIASASGASAAILAALTSVGATLSSLTAVVNPAIRANALSEGNNMVLDAESKYFLCIASAGITRISKSKLTPCGAQLLVGINSGIAATNRLLVGLMPSASDASRVQAAPAVISVPAPTVDAINRESGASRP